MKKILLTNDDGYEGDGLKALIEGLRGLGDLSIVAPASEKSACGHGITLKAPLRFISLDDDFYKLEDGTPADCVYLALNTLFKEGKPDLIVSGINRGANLGEDVTYSGTAAAAMEGCIYGIPSIAISQVMTKTEDGTYDYNYDNGKVVIKELVEKIFAGEFPLEGRKFLNVNIPNVPKGELKGIKVTKKGYRYYGNDAHMHRNPRGEEHYWLGLHPLDFKDEEGTDYKAIQEGYASITPIKVDMTSHEDIKDLKRWITQ